MTDNKSNEIIDGIRLLSTLCMYIIGGFFAFAGVCGILLGEVVAGGIMFTMGMIAIPYVRTFVADKTKTKRINGVVAIVISFMLLFVFAVVVPTPEYQPTETSAPKATPIITPNPTPIITPNPTPAPTPTPKIGTYETPTPLGKRLTSSTGALNIGIASVNRGENVDCMIQRENTFNDRPASGNEYMLVSIIVGYKEMSHLDNDEKFLLSSYDFDAYANNVECDSPFLVLPEEFDTSSSTYMMPGSVSTVWKIFEVPKGERVTIAYDRTFVHDVYYFDTGTGDFKWDSR